MSNYKILGRQRMTTILGRSDPFPAVGTSVRRLGRICVWAGLLGALSGVVLAVWPAGVPDDRYSYPFGAAAFVVAQLWFAVQHLGLLAGILGLGRCGAAGTGTFGVRLAAAGMAALALVELAAISAARSLYPDGLRTQLLDLGYGLATVAIGVGLVAAGVAVLRARVWSGRHRFVPLALGVWVFVPMLPALLAPFVAARLAITGWMLLFALLGVALVREERG
jgi:hypothetical protein